MTTSPSNRDTSNTDDTIVDAGHSHGTTTSAALYYPSLIGNCWYDEPLPTGALAGLAAALSALVDGFLQLLFRLADVTAALLITIGVGGRRPSSQ
jgi:hypothetical protein